MKDSQSLTLQRQKASMQEKNFCFMILIS